VIKTPIKILGIFTVLLFLNLWLQKHDIQIAYDPICDVTVNREFSCLRKDIPFVGAYYMAISAYAFIFFSLFPLKKKISYRFPVILAIFWVLMSEIVVRIFHINVVTVSLLGKVSIFDSLYFEYRNNEGYFYIIFLLISSPLITVLANQISNRLKFPIKQKP